MMLLRLRVNLSLLPLLCGLCILVPSTEITSQESLDSDSQWLAGWNERVRGEIIAYESGDPDARTALLVRSVDEALQIEWKTERVPLDLKGDWVNFVWIFGVDANPEQRRWSLQIDGLEWVSFSNPKNTEQLDWKAIGREGTELRFRGTHVDQHSDIFGYAQLRLPRAAVKPGEALELQVVGESSASSVWYMTFMTPIAEGVRLHPRAALLRPDAQHKGRTQPLGIRVTHLGEQAPVHVTSSIGVEVQGILAFGSNELELRLPESAEAREVSVQVKIGEHHAWDASCTVEPIKPWRIDLVQHTHTDIGYTRPQTEILPEHLRFIDYALDYCDQTDDFPEEARFRWTCETSWAVREYLNSRTPDQIARLKKRVNEGRIELTAMFFNMSEVIDEGSYAAYLHPVRDFHEAGLPVVTAMQNDINGAAWCLADYFSKIGVRYLTMGQHGHRALKPFDKATSFWWESPAGNRVLAYRADHYNTGNRWGVHTRELASVETGVFAYLAEMEAKGYPFDRVAVQYSGYLTDNSPPAIAGNEVIRDWNAKYVWPKLRSSVAGDFLSWVEREHGKELPVVRAAWPDWWTDGFGSAARESAAARQTQAEMTATESLFAMEYLLGLDVPKHFEHGIRTIRDELLFYGEHTFGAAESITDPLGENSVVQWAEKSAYVWEAVKNSALMREKALGLFQTRIDPSDVPILAVVNTLPHKRSGQIELYVDHEILPLDKPFRIVDDEGLSVPAQLLRSRSDGSYWALWVPEVPAFGFRSFRIVHEKDLQEPPAVEVLSGPARTLENKHYRLEIDPKTGALSSLFDKALNRELVDQKANWQLGLVIYETLGNREQIEAYMLENFKRTTVTNVEVQRSFKGAIWQSLTWRAQLPHCEGERGLEIEVRLYDSEKLVELHYRIRKNRNYDPEALYVAFPFHLPAGKIAFETLGGIATPGVSTLDGSASDWQTAQSFAAVQSPIGQVLLSSDEIPLFHFGDLNIGKFQRTAKVRRPHAYSWVMNNYWTTNFRASQEGELRWSYALSSNADATNGAASRFGWEHRIPLLGRVLPAGSKRTPTQAASLLTIDNQNIILVSARRATRGEGVILLLREVDGVACDVDLQLPSEKGKRTLTEVTVLEKTLNPVEGALHFEPFEPKFVRLQ